MKKYISALTALLIILSTVLIGGCEEKTDKIKKKTTAVSETATASQVVTENTKPAGKKTDSSYTSAQLKKYLDSFVKGKNPVYGTWKIKGDKTINYIFRNDNFAQMVFGTEAMFAELKINEADKTLSVMFIRGMNGDYTYSVSKDGKTMTLKSDKDSFTLEKQQDFSIVPKLPNNPKIDKKILGWWKNSGGNFYFFASDGVMYSNNISIETGYTYNAGKGKINAVYDYAGKTDISFKYKLKKGHLYIDGEEFIKYTPDELK